MPNKNDLSKPWYQALNSPLRSWTAAGNSENIGSSLQADLEDNSSHVNAIIIIQECNIGGRYYRYFWYKNGNDERYFQVSSHLYFTGCEVGVDQMQVGSIVKLGGKEFSVNEGTGNDFVKLLFPVSA